MSVLIGLCGLAVVLVGLVAVIPGHLRRLRIYSRTSAAVVIGFGGVLLVIADGLAAPSGGAPVLVATLTPVPTLASTPIPPTASPTIARTVTPSPTSPPPTATPKPPTPTPRPPSATATPTVEYQLALIQTGGYITPIDPLVGQFKQALDTLQPHCQESRRVLSDYTVASHNLLAQAGISESYLSIVQSVAKSIPAALTAPTKCDQLFAAYVTLREHGFAAGPTQ